MQEELIKFCFEKGILLDKDVSSLLSDFDTETSKRIIEKISSQGEKLITRSFLNKNADRISGLIGDKIIIEKLKIKLGVSIEISRDIFKKEEKEEVEKVGNIKIINSLVNLAKKLEPADFVKHFRNRYNAIKGFLQERAELDNLSSINKLSSQRQNVSIIGMVFNKRVSKNKNIILEVEDLTGRVNVLVNRNKDVYNIAKEILPDDIIGIKGSGNNEIIFANNIVYPDSVLQEKNYLERDEAAAFISDVHIGSTKFLEKNFLRFISWLNGEIGDEKQRQEASKIKYLFITGDTIDGVGVFPGQEELLEIKDVRKQYEKLAEFLSKIRKDVKIILCPGQHDAVRIAEPQPFIGRDYAFSLYGLDNILFVSNPSLVEITNNGKKGIKILMYHGASMISFVNEIESLRLGKAHDNPSKVVKEILKRRHLAILHSSVTYIPTEKEDKLVINEIPDIINTADFHRPDVDTYNNILIVCSSCWQSITPFEEKVGNHPDPCKVPVVNLKTRRVKILDFSDTGEEEK